MTMRLQDVRSGDFEKMLIRVLPSNDYKLYSYLRLCLQQQEIGIQAPYRIASAEVAAFVKATGLTEDEFITAYYNLKNSYYLIKTEETVEAFTIWLVDVFALSNCVLQPFLNVFEGRHPGQNA